MTTLNFHDLIRRRSSVRGFQPEPVEPAIIRAVLEDAQLTPSACNTQPWDVHIVSGRKKDELSETLLQAAASGEITSDFFFDQKAFYGRYSERQIEQAVCYQQALGISRDDLAGRQRIFDLNLTFYNAPHVAFLFMPSFGDDVHVASDIGMYGQSFLLSLVDKGLGGIPQISLSLFPAQIRAALGIEGNLKLLFGISFGYPDVDFPGALMRMERDPIETCVTFHE